MAHVNLEEAKVTDLDVVANSSDLRHDLHVYVDYVRARGGMYPQPWAFDVGSQARMLGRHVKGADNIVYADGHAVSSNTNRTWRSIEDNNWPRYQITTDVAP